MYQNSMLQSHAMGQKKEEESPTAQGFDATSLLPTGGMGKRNKRIIFGVCGCCNGLAAFILLIFFSSLGNMYDGIEEACKRVNAADDRFCTVMRNSDGDDRGVCDESCSHDLSAVTDATGPMAPGMYGADWSSKKSETYDKQTLDYDWTALVRHGDACKAKGPSERSSDPVIDCPCGNDPIQLSMRGEMPDSTCIVVTWHTPKQAIAGTVPCLFLPELGEAKAEIAMGVRKSEELDRCKEGANEFASMSGSKFKILGPLFGVFAWMLLVSVVCLCDQSVGDARNYLAKYEGEVIAYRSDLYKSRGGADFNRKNAMKMRVFQFCGCWFIMFFVILIIFMICVGKMSGTLNKVCERMNLGDDRFCQVNRRESNFGACDEKCEFDPGLLVGSAGPLAPALFGAGNWRSKRVQKGGDMADWEDETEWSKLVRVGDGCKMKSGGQGGDPVVTCACSMSPFKFTISGGTGTVMGNTCAFATYGMPADMFHNGGAVPCVYLPAIGEAPQELALGAKKTIELARCDAGQDFFASIGTVLWPFLLAILWVLLISGGCWVYFWLPREDDGKRYGKEGAKDEKKGAAGPSDPMAIAANLGINPAMMAIMARQAQANMNSEATAASSSAMTSETTVQPGAGGVALAIAAQAAKRPSVSEASAKASPKAAARESTTSKASNDSASKPAVRTPSKDQLARAREQEKELQKKQQKELEAKLGPLGQPGAYLEVEIEGSGWERYADSDIKQVKDQVSGGASTFIIMTQKGMCVVDWSNQSNLTQKNHTTGKVSQLRVVGGGAFVAAEESAAEEEEEEEEEQAPTPKAVTPAAARSSVVTPKAATPAVRKGSKPTTPVAAVETNGPIKLTAGKIIQVETASGGWSSYTTAEIDQVRERVDEGLTSFVVSRDTGLCVIDWSNTAAPTQKNVQTGKFSKLRVANAAATTTPLKTLSPRVSETKKEPDARRLSVTSGGSDGKKATPKVQDSPLGKASPKDIGSAKTVQAATKKDVESSQPVSKPVVKKKTPLKAPPKAKDPDELPEGWDAATDPSSGKTYWYNHDLGVSQWEKPVAPKKAAAPLPPPAAERERRPSASSTREPEEEDQPITIPSVEEEQPATVSWVKKGNASNCI
jgi:hypothetical protein